MNETPVQKAKECLIKASGWSTQEFGLGRIIGEVFALIFLSKDAVSLDDISEALSLSKAAVSIATRQLDKLSLLIRVKIPGDRKVYYRISAHFAASLQNGIFEILRSKLKTTKDVLIQAETYLMEADDSPETEFLKEQIQRAKRVRDRTDQIINNPILKMMT